MENHYLLKKTDEKTRLFGYDMSTLCRLGHNILQLYVTSCCCSFNFSVKSAFSIPFSQLLDSIKINNHIGYDEAVTLVRSSFNISNDIQELFFKISLNCPLSYSRINIPAKGKACKHIQCFDLYSYLDMNQRNPKWKCPVCAKIILNDDLLVDGYMEKILMEAQRAETIKIVPDASWEVLEEIADDDEDEDDGEDEPQIKKQKIEGIAEPIDSLMIDLT